MFTLVNYLYLRWLTNLFWLCFMLVWVAVWFVVVYWCVFGSFLVKRFYGAWFCWCLVWFDCFDWQVCLIFAACWCFLGLVILVICWWFVIVALVVSLCFELRVGWVLFDFVDGVSVSNLVYFVVLTLLSCGFGWGFYCLLCIWLLFVAGFCCLFTVWRWLRWVVISNGGWWLCFMFCCY